MEMAKMPWLPEPPPDFQARCKALRLGEGIDGSELIHLAQHRLDLNQLILLGRTLQALRQRAQGTPKGLTPFRLGVTGHATLNLLAGALPGAGLRYGLDLTVIPSGFGQLAQEALDPSSTLNQARADGVYIQMDHRGLPFLDPLSAPEKNATVNSESAQTPDAPATDTPWNHLKTLHHHLIDHGAKSVILETIPTPPEPLFGSFDACHPASLQRQIQDFNQQLTRHTPEGCFVLDTASLAEGVGLYSWFDPMQWHWGKMPFAQSMIPLACDHLSRLIAGIRGRSRKCLVLDLDNTLWGGVIGDDGLEGIRLGQGSAEGEAFVAMQRHALNLQRRGVILAVCSKNDQETALLPFRHHPEMILKEEHIALFVANWQDKATNLEEIAATLNIGLDALVLADDNPAERAQVRGALPQVGVPELPEDASLYPRWINAGGYFEAIAFTADDQQRTHQYQGNLKRQSLQKTTRSLDDFLQALQMSAQITPFNPLEIQRITQLINKTNQFNLTTRRRTEAEIRAVMENPHFTTWQMRLTDRFGDNGLISLVICRRQQTNWEIDTWLMSCRVINRQVEKALFIQLLHQARALGIKRLTGRHIPTPRNGLVKEHYAQLGFTPFEACSGKTEWHFDTDKPPPPAPPIHLVTDPA
ncbi:MAG: HAD family hydrolase [Magnetococcales bacterium]|nr:HAD family hydrolase [Magnetococcales bacterium]